jgi:predicted flap endonuclease-1-like 5' DNA nuclease
MLFSYILLHASTFQQDLPIGLALCIVPAILGWLAAYSYYKVGSLKAQVAELTTENTSLKGKVASLTEETTDLRVKLTQADSQIFTLNEQIRKLKNDLIICESDLNAAKNKGGAPAAKAAAATIVFNGTKYKQDDLKIVEGIGPKIAEILQAGGVDSWATLASTSVDRLRELLDAAGPSFNIHDPGTWPHQASLANEGKWDELKKLQDELDGGKAG